MKKMLFTAIALVAFAGTSMGNTKEVKKNMKPLAIKELSSQCVKAINAYMAVGYPWYEAIYYAADSCK